MTPDQSFRAALLAGALALALGGCVVAPAAPYAYAPYETVVVAPPPPRVEIVGAAPYPGYLWIGGYWTWRGSRHDWVPGYWQAPRPGYSWAPHRWVPQGRGWQERPGHWQRQQDGRDGGRGGRR